MPRTAEAINSGVDGSGVFQLVGVKPNTRPTLDYDHFNTGLTRLVQVKKLPIQLANDLLAFLVQNEKVVYTTGTKDFRPEVIELIIGHVDALNFVAALELLRSTLPDCRQQVIHTNTFEPDSFDILKQIIENEVRAQ